ncbi:MAG TPA: hypothetical protein VNQ77_04540 [Frankiaceae bacterium]|nr:hypothetical protein [Frankiaceae bacterium]
MTDKDYAAAAITSLQSIQPSQIHTGDQHVAAAGIYAVTYALLDLAAAIREQGSR